MFRLSYLWAELRRRKARTALTALGLGVGVALVVCVTALSAGLDRAQDEAPSGPMGIFGQGQVTAGSTSVLLEAPVDFGLIVLAVSLADALRHID